MTRHRSVGMSECSGRVILGVDPGTASTGFGVISVTGKHLKVLDYGVVETPAHAPLERRLELIFDEITKILERHRPTAAAVESLYFNANVRTALAVGEARGVAVLACAQAGCEVFEYTPQQVKQAVVGYGRAEKGQVMEMVRVLLGMSTQPRPDHAADALGVAICHANSSALHQQVMRSSRPGARARRRKSR